MPATWADPGSLIAESFGLRRQLLQQGGEHCWINWTPMAVAAPMLLSLTGTTIFTREVSLRR